MLITCPDCRNRHVISDHLDIFGTKSSSPDSPNYRTVEELVRARGGIVKKGTLGEDGDVEFWEDGTATVRAERQASEDVKAYRKPAHAEGEPTGAPGSTFGRGRADGSVEDTP